jgi:hypothetical protein
MVFVRIYSGLIAGFFLILIGQACSSPKQFNAFDSTSWRNDPFGCRGERLRLTNDFEKIRRSLRGLSQSDITDLLGKPDFQGLYTRHQKFFVYYMEKGPQCQHAQAESTARTVAVRFGALGNVTEVSYQQGRP